MTVDRRSVLRAGLIVAGAGSFPSPLPKPLQHNPRARLTYSCTARGMAAGAGKKWPKACAEWATASAAPRKLGLESANTCCRKTSRSIRLWRISSITSRRKSSLTLSWSDTPLGGRASPGRRTRSPTASGISSTSTALSWRTARAHSAYCPPMLWRPAQARRRAGARRFHSPAASDRVRHSREPSISGLGQTPADPTSGQHV